MDTITNMKLHGQNFEVTADYLILRLKDPYWSAWQRFGWVEGTEGYSVNVDAIAKAKDLKKKILVKNKYGDYEITPTKAERDGGDIKGRDGTLMLCIPRSSFKKLPATQEPNVQINYDTKLKLGEMYREILKKKQLKSRG